MKPRAFGYLHVDRGVNDDDVRQWESDLRGCAEREGYCLVRIFYEYERGGQFAFAELVAELRRTGACCVFTPSLAHFSTHRLLRNCMVELLDQAAGTEVLTLNEGLSSVWAMW